MTDNRTTELLPCPFCGGEAELKYYQSGDWQVICYHADGCIMRESDLDNCYWENVQTLVRQWNTRAHGTLTAEQVSKAIERHVKFYEGGDYDEQAIADELNAELGSGTCDDCEHDGRYECPGCGCVVYYDLLADDSWTIYMDDYQIPFNNCPKCGKAVTR